MKGMRARFSGDDGMTLLEVVIAAAILFIIMTAVLGLIGQTMQMGSQAKEINVSNNAVNSYVEWVRSLPFSEVDTVSGSLETTIVVADEYTITIEPAVEEGDNASLKNMTLAVHIARADGFTENYSTMVVIRDRDQHLTEAMRSPSTDPKVQYISPTPPDGTVIWFDETGTWWKDAGGTTRPVQFSVKAEASAERTLEMVTIQGEDSWLLKDVFSNTALWSEPVWSVSPVFNWDGAQETIIGELQTEEGKQDIWVWATDSAGARGADMRVYIIDNEAPDAVPEPVFNPTGSMAGMLSWEAVNDGNAPADHYYVRVLRHDVYGTWPNWPVAIDSRIGETSIAPPSDRAFARYIVQVAAESPLNRSTAFSAWMSFVTKPRVTGTYTLSGDKKKWDVTSVSLTASPPAFPTTGTTTYEWFSVNGATETSLGAPSSTATTLTRTKDSVTDYPTTPLLGYRCKVTCTANGMYAPTGAVTYVSNTVYPEMPAGTAKTFTDGTW